jgi:putative aldouronate transport system permease protein
MTSATVTPAGGRASRGPRRGRPHPVKHLRRYWQLWVMAAPAIAFVAVFSYIPMYGLQLAFREFDFAAGFTGGEWVGLKYFHQFFDSPQFWTLIRNTVVISVSTLVVGFVAPIALALMVNQVIGRRRKKFLQTATYLPHFISIVVIVGMLQVFLSPSSGLITRVAGLLGFDGANFLGSATAFVPVYVISEVWQHAGWNSIIYLAALSSVDTQLYEAARIDGAGKFSIIRHVDVPALIPTMVVLLILNMGNVLNTGFEKIFLMQNPLNLGVSEVIATYVYKIGILSSQFSYATAIGLFNTLINFAFLVIANQIAKRVSNTSLW